MDKIINLNQFPTSRIEALNKNSNHYFTGVPCRNGHIEKRRTTDAKCLKVIVNIKRKRKNRPEDVSKMRKAYYQKTKTIS